jgi:hypothetical protein
MTMMSLPKFTQRLKRAPGHAIHFRVQMLRWEQSLNFRRKQMTGILSVS